jgi:hypothetical protein
MHLPSSVKTLRQRAIAVALLLSAVLAVAVITITALTADPASARSGRPSDPVAATARGVVNYVEMLVSGGHWE